MGKTGAGKTHLIKELCKVAGGQFCGGQYHFPIKDKIGISSAYMLFVLGSFGLHDEHKNTAIGFLGSQETDSHLPKSQADFIKMGLFAELAGRIGQTIHLKPLNNQMLADILNTAPHRFWLS